MDRVKICGGSSSNFQYKGTHVEFSHPPDVFASFMKFANSRCVTSMFSTCPEKRPHRKSISDPNLPPKMATKLGQWPLMLWWGLLVCFVFCRGEGEANHCWCCFIWLIFRPLPFSNLNYKIKSCSKPGRGEKPWLLIWVYFQCLVIGIKLHWNAVGTLSGAPGLP